jgi:hypothetical protein
LILLLLPITVGAVVFEAKGLLKFGGFEALNASPFVMLLGIATSALSGFWAIGFLLNYLKTRDVTLFVVWRVLIAILVFVVYYGFGAGSETSSVSARRDVQASRSVSSGNTTTLPGDTTTSASHPAERQAR